jgi:hypothetical protein
MRWQDFASWPQAHLRHMGWAVLAGLGILGVNALITPKVEPIYPAELGVSSETPGAGLNLQGEQTDFVTRPLFLASRRPTQAVVVEEVMPEPTSQLQEVSLEGIGLLGVFASGGVGGAIVELEDGARSRVYVGESVNGWQLSETSLRSAVFVSPSGAISRLELAVASTLPNLETVRPSRAAVVDESRSAQAEREPEPETPSDDDSGLVTFGSIAKSKARKAEALRRAAEESTDG